jgi:hypothetical protein
LTSDLHTCRRNLRCAAGAPPALAILARRAGRVADNQKGNQVTDTELAELRRRLDAIDAETAQRRAVDDETARRKRLTRAEWEHELSEQQTESQGLPWRWLETAQATGDRLLAECGLRLTVAAPTVAEGDREQRDAALAWWNQCIDVLLKYRDVLHVQRWPDVDLRLPRNDAAFLAVERQKGEARKRERQFAARLAALGIKKP